MQLDRSSASKEGKNQFVVAYLAPEIPALSATFVYEEILGLERLGVHVVPFSVHAPISLALGQEELASRVSVLYDQFAIRLLLKGLFLLPLFQSKSWFALRCLLSDMWECGPQRRTSWKLAYQFLTGVRLASALKEKGCTHLHIHFAHVPTQIGMYASLLSGIPFTVMAHANDIFERGLLLKCKAARAQRFLTISEYNVRFLRTQGIPENQLAVVRCGVSLAANASPKHQGLTSTVIRVGSLGRLVEKKGFDILIRAVAILKQRGCAIELRIAGDGPLRTELVRLAHSLDVEEAVIFEGSLTHSKVSAWMKNLDIFALACKQDQAGDMDGIPVVLMEAMSQAIAVVSTRISGIPELVIHEETGMLAHPNDAEDFADQIERLVQARTLVAAVTAKAFAHVKGEFSQDVNLKRLIAYFEASNKKLALEK